MAVTDGSNFRLKAARQALGFSQRYLAKELGVKPSTWSEYEAGKYYPPNDVLVAFKLRFDITTDWVLAADPRGLPDDIRKSIYAQAREPDAPRTLSNLLPPDWRQPVERDRKT
jgi:transcriptional regulator with XRE-family HTH domain